MIKKRFEHIDFLRALSIIGVIAIHTYSYHLNNTTYYLIWNYLNFVVVSFIFCSGYVLTYLYKDRFTTEFKVLGWYKKRILKLIIPFYIYLVVHYSLWLIFPQFFVGLELERSFNFILRSIFLVGGVELNWLVLLFVQLTLIFPFLMRSLRYKIFYYLYECLAIAVALIFTFMKFPHDYYRTIMWLPWSVILLLSMRIYLAEHKDTGDYRTIKRYLFGAILSGLFFILLVIFHIKTNRSFQLVSYKYPPGFFYITYGQTITFLILIIGIYSIHKINTIKKISLYVSKHSYQLYFIHFIILDLILKISKQSMFFSQPFIQFVLILSISIGICIFLNNSLKLLKKQPPIKEAA